MHHEWHSDEYGGHHGKAVYHSDTCTLINCEGCGFTHVVPLPAKAELARFYEQEFYQSEKPDYLKRNDEDQKWRALEFSDRYKIVEDKMAPDMPRRVLDIGCGPGDFLAAGLARGWDCVGVEPSPAAAEFASARGAKVTNAPFDASLAPSLGSFSFIHMSEVLEHIPNPEELLGVAYGMLKPGGVLCVSVPNDFNAFQQAFCNETGSDKWWIVPDHHLNYFDFDSLGSLLTRCGFSVFDRSTNFPMELFLLMGLDYTSDPDLGKSLHAQRKRLDLTLAGHQPESRRKFYQALANAGLGRLVVLFAIKN